MSVYLIIEVLWELKQYSRICNIKKNEWMNIVANPPNKLFQSVCIKATSKWFKATMSETEQSYSSCGRKNIKNGQITEILQVSEVFSVFNPFSSGSGCTSVTRQAVWFFWSLDRKYEQLSAQQKHLHTRLQALHRMILITHKLTGVVNHVWSPFQTGVNSQTGAVQENDLTEGESSHRKNLRKNLNRLLRCCQNHFAHWNGSIADNTLGAPQRLNHKLGITLFANTMWPRCAALGKKTEDSPLSLATGQVASKNQQKVRSGFCLTGKSVTALVWLYLVC